MKQTQKPGKRIVSKGCYALAQGIRVGQAVAGVVAILLGALMGILISSGICLMVPHLKALAKAHDVLLHLTAASAYLAMMIYLGYILIQSMRLGFTGLKEAAKSEVVPFTRANTGHLPDPDSLVRASQEPTQLQETVLLRAVAEQARPGQETQLVRPAMTRE